MPNRREILQGGAALGAVAMAGGTLLGGAGNESRVSAAGTQADLQHYHRILFEAGSPSSCTFAAEAARLGGNVTAIQNGDVRDFWYRELYPEWQARKPVVIAGLTTEAAAFDLEIFGRDAGYWRVFRGDHLASAGAVNHCLAGAACLLQGPEHALTAAADWPQRLAQLLGRFNANSGIAGGAFVSAPTPRIADGTEHLVSWVIAPRSVPGA